MNYRGLKAISWLLIASLAGGCGSTRRIRFTSNPPGALVTAGGKTCTTPCYLDVPIHTEKAVFALYSGAKEEVSIDHLTTRGATAQYGAGKTGEFALAPLGLSLFLTGLLALGLAESYQTDAIQTGQHSSRDETIFWIAAATGMTSGSLILFLAQEFSDSANDVKPEVHVALEKPQHSPPVPDATATQPSSQGELFRLFLKMQEPPAQKKGASDFFK
ncbi:MAG TPA: hypothetical protein VI298_05820 [Geobacteraceae bacterium]